MEFLKRLAICFFLLLPGAAGAAEPEPLLVEAAILRNLLAFATWPAGLPDPIELCFPAGESAVAGALEALPDKPIQGVMLKVRKGVNYLDLRGCNAVFLGEEDQYRQWDILRGNSGKPILMVGDLEGFLDAGGMIEIFPEGLKFRFGVNLDSVRAGGLVLDSRLIALARRVVQTK